MTVRIGGRGAPREPWLGGFGTLRAPVHDARRAPSSEPAPDLAPSIDAVETLAPSVEGMPDGVLPIRPAPLPPSAPPAASAPGERAPAGETMGGFGGVDPGAAGTAAGFGGYVDAAWGGEGPRPGDPSIDAADGIGVAHPIPLREGGDARADSVDARPSASAIQRGHAGARRAMEIEVRTAAAQPASVETMGAAPAAGFGRDASTGFDPLPGFSSAGGGTDGMAAAGGMTDAGAISIPSTPSTAAGDGIIRRAMDEAASAPAAPPVMGSGPDHGQPRGGSTASETPDGSAADAPAHRPPRSSAEPRSLEELQVRVEQMGAMASDALTAAERAGTAVRARDGEPGASLLPGAARFPWLADADDGDEDDDPVLRFFRARDRAHEAAPSAEPAQGRHVHIGSVHVTVAAPAPSAAPPPAAPAPAPYADPWAGYPRIFD